LVGINPVVSEEEIFMWISHRVLCVLFQKWVQRFGPLTKMASTAEFSLT
jgi:hypothetical protein